MGRCMPLQRTGAPAEGWGGTEVAVGPRMGLLSSLFAPRPKVIPTPVRDLASFQSEVVRIVRMNDLSLHQPVKLVSTM